MKKVELKDLKVDTLYWKSESGDLTPIETVYVSENGLVRFCYIGRSGPVVAKAEDLFFELPVPALGSAEIFSKTYDTDSLNDVERDMYEMFDDAAEQHPEEVLRSASFIITCVMVPEGE